MLYRKEDRIFFLDYNERRLRTTTYFATVVEIDRTVTVPIISTLTELRIWMYPGSLSRIPDPTIAIKGGGGNNLMFYFFCGHNIRKL
jgi:hypothetical protein